MAAANGLEVTRHMMLVYRTGKMMAELRRLKRLQNESLELPMIWV